MCRPRRRSHQSAASAARPAGTSAHGCGVCGRPGPSFRRHRHEARPPRPRALRRERCHRWMDRRNVGDRSAAAARSRPQAAGPRLARLRSHATGRWAIEDSTDGDVRSPRHPGARVLVRRSADSRPDVSRDASTDCRTGRAWRSATATSCGEAESHRQRQDAARLRVLAHRTRRSNRSHPDLRRS